MLTKRCGGREHDLADIELHQALELVGATPPHERAWSVYDASSGRGRAEKPIAPRLDRLRPRLVVALEAGARRDRPISG